MHKKTLAELEEELKGDESALAFIRANQTFTFQIEREELEDNKSFSSTAMIELSSHMLNFIQAQVYKKWALSGEPPSAMSVKVKVDIH